MHPVYSPREQVDDLLFDVSHFESLSGNVEHSHSCVEITLIVKGRTQHSINGKSEHAYPGSLYLFYPGSTHHLHDTSACEGYNISCPPDFMRIIGAELSCLQNFRHLFSGETLVVGLHVNGLLFHDIKTIVVKMYDAFSNHETPDRLVSLRSMFSVFLVLMTQAELPKRNLSAEHGIAEAARFMERHYAEPITLAQLSRMSCMSKNHFIRKFSAKFAQSPIRYLIDLRLTEARKKLLETNFTVNTVAAETGFCCGSHLSREYAKKYNMSISETRKLNDQSENSRQLSVIKK